MQAFAERLSLFALEFNQPMRDVILVEEVVELMTFARAAGGGENAQTGKFTITSQTTAAHDERIDDGRAHAGYFRESASQF